ncbi:MAG: hypothetical protein E4H02_12080 [Lentisphaerales bacterium]|nr:MAG: hypothetical protein E4H02_12080 [Lentisphaerales bacterium]
MRYSSRRAVLCGWGGSVRGYAFQSLGPMTNNVATGGRSMIEVSLELRTRISEHIGFVIFADGGNAFSDEMPDDIGDLMWACGAGIRLYTGIGPLRLDVAAPLNRREGTDDSFQVYFSIGQSF